MSRAISDLKEGVAGLLTGTNLDNVHNIERAFERALSVFLQKASVPEASTSVIKNLYDGIYNYISPSAIFGGALRDIRPLGVTRSEYDYVYRQPIALFDRTKSLLPNGYAVTFETESGINLMRIANVKATPKINLDTMDATTGWTAAGSAGSLVKDASFFYQSSTSLRFTLTGASTGTLTKNLTTAIDLTSYQGVGVVFLALEIPAMSLTSLTLKLGSDASNYYSLAVTQGFLGAWTAGDFIITAFDLASASTTGTPVITAMDYVQLSFAHSATMTNTRVGGLFISLPSPHKIFYETTAIFQNTAGIISNLIDADSDTILLNDSAYTIFEIECAVAVAIQQAGGKATAQISNFNGMLNGARARNGAVIQLGLYDLYRSANPAEEVRSIDSWYD